MLQAPFVIEKEGLFGHVQGDKVFPEGAPASLATMHRSATFVLALSLWSSGSRRPDRLRWTKGPTRLVAIADMFGDRLDGCLDALGENDAMKKRVEVAKDKRFVGPDAYLGVFAADCDIVVIATPPHFRPAHFEAAIAAKKHVFFEKPVATFGAITSNAISGLIGSL